MDITDQTPYEIVGVSSDVSYVELRRIYRIKIHQYKKKQIDPIEFRRICRAYETLSDFDKRKRYDSDEQWIAELPIHQYTLQQLAAESDLLQYLNRRLENAYIDTINAQDSVTGHTALYCAARAGNVRAVKLLIERGAEADLSQRTKSTALHVASFYGHADVVRCLLESGADYRIINMHGSTAEEEAYDDDVKEVFAEMKQNTYVRVAADELNWFHENGLTQHQDMEYFSQRQTLLHCASKKGYFNMVRWLVEKCSANADLTDHNGNSPLHLAIYGGHFNVVDYLLNRGCDPGFRNQWGATAEEEGIKHGRWIAELFQSLRERSAFEMAREGVQWWFEYYFDRRKVNKVDSNGVSLLYYTCRCGQRNIVEWLLKNRADVNIQMTNAPQSTPLHGAKYHGHVSIVELLLKRGADVTIKNAYEATVFDEAVSDTVDANVSSQINELLAKYQHSLKHHKLIDVEIYLHQTGAKTQPSSSDDGKPLVTLQINHKSNYEELIQALPKDLQNPNYHFTIAGRPLNFDLDDKCIMSVVYHARYVNSKFIDTPFRLTLHPSSMPSHRQMQSRANPSIDSRSAILKFGFGEKIGSFLLKHPCSTSQTFKCANLTFTFSANCIKSSTIFEVTKLDPAGFSQYDWPNSAFCFRTKIVEDTKSEPLVLLPLVSIEHPWNARLYTLAMPSSYWYSSDTRPNQLSVLDGIHAFIRHVDILANRLTLPIDIFIANSLAQPLESRNHPVPCQYLALRKHDSQTYPHIAYHGTNIDAIRSILIDGLVLPGTVVSSGKRINPPSNHYAREESYFNIPDFATAVFVSHSVHYSADPTYAVGFTHDDQQMIPVLECSVKNNSFVAIGNTTTNYKARPGEDLGKIEWRVTNPMDVEINGVLFITKIQSIVAATAARKTTIIGSQWHLFSDQATKLAHFFSKIRNADSFFHYH